ncbi:MAG TPA: CHRD domain-containing protein [Candidatus Binatia bacterium]|nr:CHRD domain-containing protein [Candidatus Binatia bacterium]
MRRFVTVIAILAAFFAVAGRAYSDPQELSVVLSGAQEVSPPAPAGGVVTATTARVDLRFDEGLTQVEFRLDVFKGTGVTQAHLHCARAGINGPIFVFLFPFTPAGVNVNGTLARGTFTNADIIPTAGNAACGTTVNNIASLLEAIREGRVYANVHTLTNPAGEIRAQVFVDDVPL